MRNKAVIVITLLLMVVGSSGRTQPTDPGFDPAAPPPAPAAPGNAPRNPAPGGAPSATPAAAPDRGIATEGKNIKINFPEMELEAVLKNFAQITGKSFILDQMPKGQIKTIGPIGPVEIPKQYAYDYFVLIMSMNGYTIVKTSVPNVFKVVRTADAGREAGLPVIGPGGSVRSNESMITRFIQVKYVTATDLAGQLAQLTSKEGGQVVAYQPTNMLIIMDTAINIERMIKIIRLLDVPAAEPEMEIIKLKYMTAEDASAVLSQVYTGATSGAGPRSATTREIPGRGRNRPAVNAPGMPAGIPQPQPQPVGGGAGESNIKIIPLERMNSLLIITDADSMAGIKDLIAKIDVDVGLAMGIHVYYVQNAEASDLAGTLSGLSGGSQSSSRSSSSSSRSTSATTNRPDGMGGMAPMPVAAPVQPRQTQTAGGNLLEGMFGNEVTINSDEATNSLIVVASPQDYELLLSVIKKLDIPRRQVFVEAVLLEVTYTDSQEAGVSLHAASGLDEGGVVFGGTKMSDVSSMTLLGSLASSGGSLALPSGITIGALGAPVEVPGTNGQVMIPSAGMVVRLLASDSSVNVLSTPTILTTDNEEASIEVGQKIPVTTGSSIGTGYSNVQISRESVGIKLKITPQINESDTIRMDIFTEISSVASVSATMGPTTSLKTAETSVIVRDSQTIVIGGLMEDRENVATTKVPWLGDIPVLGWLFKTGTRDKQKTNLIILLTPHIVKSDQDVERVKALIRQGYEDIQEESLGDRAPNWDAYFDSQLRSQRNGNEVIDLRSGQPQVVPPQGNQSSDWGWTPQTAAGSTAPAPAPGPAPAPAAPAPSPAPSPAAPSTTAPPGARSATTGGGGR